MDADELLRRYVCETDMAASQRHLEGLLREHALPIVTAIVESRLRVSLRHSDRHQQSQIEADAEDVRARVMLDLTERLHQARQGSGRPPVQDFRAYVAVTTYRAFGRYLADRHRTRAALQEQVEYLLTHRRGWAIWSPRPRQRMCGLESWRAKGVGAASARRLGELMADGSTFGRAAAGAESPAEAPLTALLDRLFDALAGPVELAQLVDALARLRGIREPRTESLADEAVASRAEGLASEDLPVEEQVGLAHRVRELWAAVCQLPARECAALLLDMARADGLAVIVQFPLHGAASVADIASAVGLELEQFAPLWGELPLPDETIAAVLQCTPRQVINLRQAARRRLAQRFGAPQPEAGHGWARAATSAQSPALHGKKADRREGYRARAR